MERLQGASPEPIENPTAPPLAPLKRTEREKKENGQSKGSGNEDGVDEENHVQNNAAQHGGKRCSTFKLTHHRIMSKLANIPRIGKIVHFSA